MVKLKSFFELTIISSTHRQTGPRGTRKISQVTLGQCLDVARCNFYNQQYFIHLINSSRRAKGIIEKKTIINERSDVTVIG